MLYCEDCEKKIEPTEDNYCSLCNSEYLQTIPRVLIYINGGIPEIIEGGKNVDIEIRDYDTEGGLDNLALEDEHGKKYYEVG